MARPRSVRQTLPRLWRVLRQLWPWIRAERPLIGASLTALFCGVALRLAEPWPLKFVLDRILPVQGARGLPTLPVVDSMSPLAMLTLAAVAVVAVTGFRALFDYHQRLGFARIGNRVLQQLRTHLYLHLQGLSLSFHTRARSGDLLVRVTRDVSMLRDVTSTAVLPLLASILVLIGMLLVVALLQWRLALLAAVTVPLFVFFTSRIGRGIHQAARKQREREGAMAATAAESIAGIREVQALSLGNEFAEDFASRNLKSQKDDLKTARLSASLTRTVDVLGAISTALVLWAGALLVLRGRMTAGDLVVFLAYLKRAYKPAKDFAKHTARLAKATAAGERVLAVLEQRPEVADRPDAEPAPSFVGGIEFRNVSFHYDAGTKVLDGVGFRVAPGRTVAITGPSGGGKSTLVSLLLRLYDPSAGTVRIDERDIRDYTVASLRSQISVVLQNTLLFTGTIGENIALGTREATREQIEDAARVANAHDFIEDLPGGYDTVVGERGATLSLGQRQRIAIARAVLRKAPILVLDEPTTGLDRWSEQQVSRALSRLPGGMTTIIVTHDLRIAGVADSVVYLDGGGVVEAGSPAELMGAGGKYAELYALQTQWRHAT